MRVGQRLDEVAQLVGVAGAVDQHRVVAELGGVGVVAVGVVPRGPGRDVGRQVAVVVLGDPAADVLREQLALAGVLLVQPGGVVVVGGEDQVEDRPVAGGEGSRP